MADGSARTVQETNATEITVGCEPDFYRDMWSRSKLPGLVSYRMENIDRRISAASVLSEMLGAHIRGKDDAAINEGVRYEWLSDRQAGAIADAVKCVLSAACEDMEWVRQHTTSHEVKV